MAYSPFQPFAVTLEFLPLLTHDCPRETNVFFYQADTNRLTRGWLTAQGERVMLGSQWEPTHYALADLAPHSAPPRALSADEAAH